MSQNGKGDKRRPSAVTASEYACNWDETFGREKIYGLKIIKDMSDDLFSVTESLPSGVADTVLRKATKDGRQASIIPSTDRSTGYQLYHVAFRR